MEIIMKYVDFFGHKVSKLIIGDNPMTGHSYIEDVISGQEMLDYYTTKNLLDALFHIEECGYNTMLPLANPYMIRVLTEYRKAGGKMNFIFQPYMPINEEVCIRDMMSLEPLGVYHQGTTTDRLWETGHPEEILERIERYHKMGIPIGLGTHRPEVIEYCERESWNVDFYLACMQNARRGREGEESGFITGKTKSALTFYPSDRPIMLETLKKVEKPIIAFKIFAGGQMFLGKSEEEKKKLIKGAYDEVFSALKPNDMAAIGVFQRDFDQIKEDRDLLDEWEREKDGRAV